MSSSETDGNLINFDTSISILESTSEEPSTHGTYPNNLLDSELPIVERTQQAEHTNLSSENDTKSLLVDLEETFATIDDTKEGTSSMKFGGDDDYEVLNVLEQLDRVLNESLSDSCNGDREEVLIKKCLEELDAYLKKVEAEEMGSESLDIHTENTLNTSQLPSNLQKNSEPNPNPSTPTVLTRPQTPTHSTPSNVTYPQTPTHSTPSNVTYPQTLTPSTPSDVIHPQTPTPSFRSPPRFEPRKLHKSQSLDHIPHFATVTTNPNEPFHRLHPTRSTVSTFPAVPLASADPPPIEPPPIEQIPQTNHPPEVALTPRWSRTSMRRLRHLRLPGDASTNESASENTASEMARPSSAPSRLSVLEGGREEARIRNRSPSSSESSVATTSDSIPSRTTVPSRNDEGASSQRRLCDRPHELHESDSPLGQWPHGLSSMLACLSCSLGLFNVCRFAVLSVRFGANFVLQFFLLSLVVGLPLFALQLCLGQQLGAGVVDMWRISPLFQGVGVALLLSQALVGLYSIAGVSWMFVYFRDSFITRVDKYRWAEPFFQYRKDQTMNTSFKLSDTIPDYLSGVVYQRTNLVYGNVYGTIKFQPAFNLAVVWMIVFVSLSKGLRSYGKVVFVFTLLPVFATFIFCAKLLGMMPPEYIHVVFPETSWSEFFLNSKSWIAASQETFLTWGLLSAAVMQLASHNKNKHLLQRDSSLIAVMTFSVLLLVAFLANTCVQILHSYGYTYQPNSFEKLSSYTFLKPIKDGATSSSSIPLRYLQHNSYILGEKVIRPGSDLSSESGYQVLRFATELIPATFALLGAEKISPFWAVLFYFIMILFGIAQQLAVWHCVVTGIMAIKAEVLKSWETTITFFSCSCGFILGLPMTTELGIYVVYFLDFTVGGLWWLILVILLQIIAVFMVRGRPYSGDTVVTALFKQSSPSCVRSWAPALLSFVWNIILPVVLMILCVAFFKNGNFRELFIWHHAPSAEYWPLWARQIGSIIQLLPILLVPAVAVIQSYRYLNNGPPDILDRIQYLYRPPIGDHMDTLAIQEIASTILATSVVVPETRADDPPPKYTPPPSYATATGARIARLVRRSVRRSARRIADALGRRQHQQQQISATDEPGTTSSPASPPDYSAVLVEMNRATSTSIAVTNASAEPMTAAQVATILRGSFRRAGGGGAAASAENLVDSMEPAGESSSMRDDKGIHTTVI